MKTKSAEMVAARKPRKRFWAFGALTGIVGAGAFLAAVELVALFVAPRDGSPVIAAGSFVIDIVPRWAKELAIELFGEADKIVLLGSVGLAVVVAAAVIGVIELVRPPIGAILFGVAGALAVVAVVTRAGASPLASVPSIVGTIVGIIALRLLIGRLRRWRDGVWANIERPASVSVTAPGAPAAPSAQPTEGAPLKNVDRRGFLIMSGVVAAGAAIIGAGSRAITAATSSIASIRDALTIPAPRSTVTVPEGAELDIPGLTPLYTKNSDFYRVDTALTVPSIDPATWRLVIDGMVDTKVELSFQDLLDMGLDEYSITLTCVSNEVGGGLVGTAKWLGVPLRDVLALAGPKNGADMALSRSIDGYTASTPLSVVTDDGVDAILAVAMNGQPLPLEHGFPVRMVVPGLYGYVSATKWLTQITVTTFQKDEAYWTPRGYSAEAPIKMSSRIDTPRVDKQIAAGPTKIAGVAWAQTIGIEKVEVNIDEGGWQPATLSMPVNEDTWVQWFVDWEATAGTHYVAVRATDKQGNLQIEERAPIAPDGSSGWQRTLLRVG
ncbi:molybdopterin-dependent oxidoreductase [Agromyces atrinae]|uniref:DMSO/TMAO reductase YedYZ molybdopterin-dependent catalytic subunit n=1 Tax=Agromyces atrinae TaxID=592376 RepID=A0A4Q2M646_9MICO|nr:molybdopterin-dependent oxidoreductase [Agromyces atrinae]NYD67412.1 DMSO/TMAO reductase YedYZ molybdopterin-dependent catalytic subunit [Agromyces atrinae]RXZ86767.1 oxidoreductase [Agromyces atrinae]